MLKQLSLLIKKTYIKEQNVLDRFLTQIASQSSQFWPRIKILLYARVLTLFCACPILRKIVATTIIQMQIWKMSNGGRHNVLAHKSWGIEYSSEPQGSGSLNANKIWFDIKHTKLWDYPLLQWG